MNTPALGVVNWTPEEDERFREGIMKPDWNWDKVWECVGTRSLIQIMRRIYHYTKRTDGKEYPEIVRRIKARKLYMRRRKKSPREIFDLLWPD